MDFSDEALWPTWDSRSSSQSDRERGRFTAPPPRESMLRAVSLSKRRAPSDFAPPDTPVKQTTRNRLGRPPGTAIKDKPLDRSQSQLRMQMGPPKAPAAGNATESL